MDQNSGAHGETGGGTLYNQIVSDLEYSTTPEFAAEAERAEQMIIQLDADPDSAMGDQEARRFVVAAARMRFVADNQRRITRPESDVDPETYANALPQWLLPGFLHAHGIHLEGDTPYDPTVIKESYDRFVANNGLQLIPQDTKANEAPRGTFYGPGGKATSESFSNTWFKVYVEEDALQSALMNGNLTQVYQELAGAGLGPYAVKLSQGDRLVFYFSSDVHATGQQIEATLGKYGVRSRGPAQDVNEVIMDDATGNLILETVASNDEALEEHIPDYDPIEPPAYDRASFLTHYLRSCARFGKSPVDAFRTSFVIAYHAPNDNQYDNPEVRAAAAELAKPYPLVVRP